jgi:hypothetical protein
LRDVGFLLRDLLDELQVSSQPLSHMVFLLVFNNFLLVMLVIVCSMVESFLKFDSCSIELGKLFRFVFVHWSIRRNVG